MRSHCLRVLGLFVIMVLVGTSALAQGRVIGSVKSQAGQALKGATITGHNPAAAPSSRTATSDSKGRFSFLALGKGEWTFTVEVPGYQPMMAKVMVRLLGSNPALDMVLHAIPELPPGGPFATLDVAAVQQRLDEAAARENAGQLDEAIAIYREIAAKLPALTMVHLQLGALYERKQADAAATAEYQLVLKSEPSNAKARAALDRLSPQGNGKGSRQATRENNEAAAR